MREDEDEDDDGVDRREPIERHGWQPGEREQAVREMAAREQQIRHDEILEWCRQRAQPRADEPRRAEVAMNQHAASADPTKQWQNYIETRIKAHTRDIETVTLDIARDLVAEEKRCEALRKDVAALSVELAELKGELKMRAALDEMRERLDRLETAPARSTALKAIAG